MNNLNLHETEGWGRCINGVNEVLQHSIYIRKMVLSPLNPSCMRIAWRIFDSY